MFNGFTKETSDFLWELAFNNERPWFLEHKAQFEQVLNQPFKELANQTAELMALRFPKRGFQLHVSRIYRDARRLFGRGPYKEHLWFSLKSDEILLEGPMFWFEVGAADFSYGMGFYSATPAQMEEFRKAVDANPARFERIVKKLMKDKRLRITGEEYARAKGHHNEVIDRWYNRKRIGIEVCQDFGGDVLSANLPEILVDCYEELLPMYDFFMEFYRNGL
jgi:uncharacterized protein (TIGR02453 family)